ncbi:hypothetical protein F5144DRAFT_234341 [Chaetomium tenue]|uniref:Uncharacterized protein n=1 Tax=Chaetomium tenue TaxID=1854479 RepID=A0ACB7P8T5_9PEZI|nr:hypothetical protein F5144DRAFT_234341 [Chaetomium globosum]
MRRASMPRGSWGPRGLACGCGRRARRGWGEGKGWVFPPVPPPPLQEEKKSGKLGYSGARSGECDNPATPTPSRWVREGSTCQRRGEEGRNRLNMIKIGVKCRRWWVLLYCVYALGMLLRRFFDEEDPLIQRLNYQSGQVQEPPKTTERHVHVPSPSNQ